MRKQRNTARLSIITLALAGLIAGFALLSARLASAQTIGGTWTITWDLNVSRAAHTATLLPNGKVLAVGGQTILEIGRFTYTTINSAELYDPVTGRWSLTSNLQHPRNLHTATLLRNGQVLVVGGFDDETSPPLKYLSSAELFDPATGQWHATGSLNTISGYHRAALLLDGKVLAVGTSSHDAPKPIYSAELYDPATGTWISATAPLTLGPDLRSLTPLANGKVLGIGGKSAELYDPTTGTWSKTGFLNVIRDVKTASPLHNGNILVTGSTGSSPAAELYDPSSGAWRVTGEPSITGTATLLSDGRVLLIGNYDAYVSPTPGGGEEVYDPATGTWSQTSLHSPPRSYFTSTLLSDGRVLTAGGGDGGEFGEVVFNNAELYTPAAGPAPHPLDDAQFFVRQHYRDFLNREADADGLAFWANEITSCGGDAQCIEVKRINDSGSFFLSIEFQETGYLAYRMYLAAYGNPPNAPVPITFSEFFPDAQTIGRNVIVKQPGWEQILENNKQLFAMQFVDRPRFSAAFPPSMSPQEFVDKLNANGGSPLSQSERDPLISDLSAGRRSRAEVLLAVAENPKLAQAEFNRAFVLMQYFGYLRRNPNDAPEATLDFQGYNFWLNKLDQFNGNFVQAEMVKAFISSTEYRRRFGP